MGWTGNQMALGEADHISLIMTMHVRGATQIG